MLLVWRRARSPGIQVFAIEAMAMKWGRLIGTATGLGATMGLTAAGLVVVGLWGGRRLDAFLGSSPLLTIALAVAGAVAGQLAIWRLAVRASRRLSSGGQRIITYGAAGSAIGRALAVLASFAVPCLVGALAGIWLDRALGSGIVATILFVIGGIVVGTAILRRQARKHSGPDAR